MDIFRSKHLSMACSLSKTLIRSPISFLFSSTYRDGVRVVSSRQYSTHPKLSYRVVDPSSSELEALAVRSIEDAIHGIVVKRSTPDWLPFVPGASFWVPPKRTNFGVAEMVHKIAYTSALSDDEVMSLTTFFGWPSSEFFIQDESYRETAGEASCGPSLSSNDEG